MMMEPPMRVVEAPTGVQQSNVALVGQHSMGENSPTVSPRVEKPRVDVSRLRNAFNSKKNVSEISYLFAWNKVIDLMTSCFEIL